MVNLTIDELRLVKSFILLPIVMSIFQRDKKVMLAKLKSPGPYMRKVDAGMEKVTKDLAEVRRQMRAGGIKIIDEKRTDKAVECMSVCRGYEQRHAFLWERLRAETEVRMRYYLGEDVDVNKV